MERLSKQVTRRWKKLDHVCVLTVGIMWIIALSETVKSLIKFTHKQTEMKETTFEPRNEKENLCDQKSKGLRPQRTYKCCLLIFFFFSCLFICFYSCLFICLKEQYSSVAKFWVGLLIEMNKLSQACKILPGIKWQPPFICLQDREKICYWNCVLRTAVLNRSLVDFACCFLYVHCVLSCLHTSFRVNNISDNNLTWTCKEINQFYIKNSVCFSLFLSLGSWNA